jgi:hypothetical protein
MIERRIMIVPIGLEKDRIIEGFLKYPVNVIYFLHNSKRDDKLEILLSKHPQSTAGVYNYSELFFNKIKEEFKRDFMEYHDNNIRLNSFSESISILNQIFDWETKKENFTHIYINISTASKIFAIAAYIFSCYHQEKCTPFYLDTDTYVILNHLDTDSSIQELRDNFLDCGLTSGPYCVQELPLIPIQKFNKFELKIALLLIKQEFYISMKRFIMETKMEYTPSNRIKVKRVLEKFDKLKLVILEKQGREKSIKISPNLKNITRFQT